ncbi:hypothetical protein FQZ97_1017160 [compost metagenome]
MQVVPGIQGDQQLHRRAARARLVRRRRRWVDASAQAAQGLIVLGPVGGGGAFRHWTRRERHAFGPIDHTIALAQVDEESVVTVQQLIKPAGQLVRRRRFPDDLLNQADLVLQVAPVQFDKVSARRKRHQNRQTHQDSGRHQCIESRQARGQRQSPEHQRNSSGSSST